jgi:hypothetical protein
MATSTGAFFAGIGTTIVVLVIGFGGGLMMAKSALNEPGGHQTRVASEPLNPVRVILPTSAEAAQPPQQPVASSTPEPVAQLEIPKQVQAIAEKDARKPEVEERERKRRYAERKAKRQAEARARQQREQRQPRGREDAPILAFGGDNSERLGGGFLAIRLPA